MYKLQMKLVFHIDKLINKFYFVNAIKTRMYFIKMWCLATFMSPTFPLG